MEKWKKLTGLAEKVRLSGKIWLLAGLFCAGLILAGGRAFFGAYPLGLAAAASASGLLGATAVFFGSLLGSAGVGGILPLVTAGVFVLRAGLSMWLASDKEGFAGVFPHGGQEAKKGKAGQVLRYSRTSGWFRRFRSRGGIRDDGIHRRKPDGQEEDVTRKTGVSAAEATGTGEEIRSRRKKYPDARLPGKGTVVVGDKGAARTDWRELVQWADRHLFTEHVFIRMAIAALAAMCAGAWAVTGGGFLAYDLWGAVFSVLLAPVCTYLFYAAHDRHMRTSLFRETGILAGLAMLTWSLSHIRLPVLGFNPGEGLALAAAVLTGGSFGVARGAMVGLSCGLLLEPVQAPAYALAGMVTGLFSARYGDPVFALGQGNSRAFGLVCGAVSAVVWAIYSGGYEGLAGLVPEILLVTAALLPFFAYDRARLPAHWCGVVPDTRRSERTAVAEMVLAGREKKLTALGSGMTTLGEMLGGVSEKLIRPGGREMRDLAERCFDVYCDRCAQRSRCREKDFAEWQRMIGGMGVALAEDGGVCSADVPRELAGRCGVMGRVLDEINASAALRMGQRRSGDRLRVAAEDYTHMGRLLTESARLEEEEGAPDPELTARLERILSCHDFAAGSVSVYGTRHKRIFVHDIDLSGTRMGGEEIMALFGGVIGMPLSPPTFSLNGPVLSMELRTRESCRCEWGKCARAASSLKHPVEKAEDMLESVGFSTGSPADGEKKAPSGDTVCAFTGDGRQYMLLSDGMGTGRMAALTSGMAAVFLERMLTAGATLETSLKMLNNVIRAGCEECAATVDLCEIDMVTLEARFVKSGAAPSFVIRGGSLFRLQSKTVPIGILRALDAEMIRFTVQPGDVIVMLSDGIARSFEDCPWLLDLLSSDGDIASGSVQRAAEKIVEQAAARGAKDDITAGVMRILG